MLNLEFPPNEDAVIVEILEQSEIEKILHPEFLWLLAAGTYLIDTAETVFTCQGETLFKALFCRDDGDYLEIWIDANKIGLLSRIKQSILQSKKRFDLYFDNKLVPLQ